MKRFVSCLTYANVVATLALFIAIGGASAFAATQLAKNSVGSTQLRKNAVTTAKIKKGAVTGAKIKLSSLGTVPSAANAQTVGGLTPGQISAQGADASKLKCPAGTAPAAGICIETSARAAATPLDAAQICGEANRVLPSMGELTAYEAQHYTTEPPYEWVGQVYYEGVEFRGLALTTKKGGTVSVLAAEASETEPYRCSQGPIN